LDKSVDLDLFRRRALFTRITRRFFVERGYLEVETPILSPYLLPEACLEVFKTHFLNGRGFEQEGYLAPSPEIWMKRLIARGSGNIFQITKSFRNLEFRGNHHNPEFSLLEWYTLNNDYMNAVEILEDLMRYLQEEMKIDAGWSFPIPRISMKEAFADYAGMDLDSLMNRDSLFKGAKALGLTVCNTESWEELFHMIFAAVILPRLANSDALILCDYPNAIPTTAKGRGDYAERWELFMGGVEIANCYSEETSQKAIEKFIEGEKERKKLCRIQHRIDEDFPKIFNGSFPDCSGVALGMDRLFMIICGEKSLDKVILFPFKSFYD
jgi:lysyl-tRNA synthetase class 2